MTPLILTTSPNTRWQWASALFVWFYFNVFLGGLAIIVSVVAWYLFGGDRQLPSEVTLGLIVLGIATAGSSADVPTKLQQFCHDEIRTWLPICSHFIALVGMFAAALTAFHPYLNRIAIEPRTEFKFSMIIMLFATLLGGTSFIVKARASNSYVSAAIRQSQSEGDYAGTADAEAKNLSDEAAKTDAFGGVKV